MKKVWMIAALFAAVTFAACGEKKAEGETEGEAKENAEGEGEAEAEGENEAEAEGEAEVEASTEDTTAKAE